MSGLSHILEAEGISTVTIGLVPQHVKTIRPPRALLVPFEMGRPFGAPNNVVLQRTVLTAALALLDEAGPGPILRTLDVAMPSTTGATITERTLAETFKLSVEDLKAFYLEAVTSQRVEGTAQELNNWFWDETAAGDLLWQLREKLKKHPDELVRRHAGFTLVPGAQVARREAKAPSG